MKNTFKSFVFTVTLLFLLMFSITACGGTKGPDYKSVYDSETKEAIALGATKTSIEKALGQGIEVTDDYYSYLNDNLYVSYNSNNAATMISTSDSTRFSILNYEHGMSISEVSQNFPVESTAEIMGPGYVAYFNFFDSKGNEVDWEEGTYQVGVTYDFDEYAGFFLHLYE